MITPFFKYATKVKDIRYYSSKHLYNTIFFGSDQFSIYSLKLLHSYYLKSELFNTLEVVTNVSKKANLVQKYAEEHNLPIYNWPYIPTHTNYDVGVVVSFGHLIPESIISKFTHGILNVHASLLPRWRGAAPIIYALAKGDTETGITIMRISPHKFDVGEILVQENLPIGQDAEMPELYQSLGALGAQCLLNTLLDLPNYLKRSQPQSADNVTYAPKVKPEFAVISWNKMTSSEVYNLSRALKGFLFPTSTWHGVPTKLSGIKPARFRRDNEDQKLGSVIYDKRTERLLVLCADDAFVSVKEVGLFGKKFMSARDFNNGFLKKKEINCRYFN